MNKFNFFKISSKELKNKSGIYKLISGKHTYVGSSKNLYSRLTEHKSDLINNQHFYKHIP